MLKSRIILPDTIQLNQEYELTGPPRQALQLWNPHRGEIITVQDTARQNFRARVIDLSSEKARIHVFARGDTVIGADRGIILHQALPEKERMEWIIQKTTELGVQTIIPFKSERSISLEERERGQKKAHRWPMVALSAARQCRRPDIPRIFPFCTFQESLRLARPSGLRIILWEKQEGGRGLADFLQQYGEKTAVPPKISVGQNISVMVGPEGGFTEAEIILARQEGFEPVHMGPRILRTETASLVMLSVIQFVLGDLK